MALKESEFVSGGLGHDVASSRCMRVLVGYGTRPEAIKVAPVIARMRDDPRFQPITVVTGQHRRMLDQVNEIFGIVPDYDLEVLKERQSLDALTARIVTRVTSVLARVQPDLVLVQGDTTTCFGVALSAFYQRIPIAHLEAGLRTGDPYDPFPEEMNRRLTAQLTGIHLAPTEGSRANLLREGVRADDVYVTGNTVIDALYATLRGDRKSSVSWREGGSRMVLVTAHRRESWGEPMHQIALGLRRIALEHPDVVVVLPVHLNPRVREVLMPPLKGIDNIRIVEPLDYADFAALLLEAHIVLTDSGGLQEEAPSLGKPVLVMRSTSERPEGVAVGTAKLVGTSASSIHSAVSTLLANPIEYARMAQRANPYGDGRAAERCLDSIHHWFFGGSRPQPFSAP